SERIYDLFGETYRDQLIPLNASDVRTNILGFVGKPSVARAHQSAYFSINSRPVRDPALMKAIKEAYATLIPVRYHPFVVLNISLPHEDIDVNIDPQKHTIQLYNSEQVYQLISSQIKDILYQHNLIPRPVAKTYSVKMDKETQHVLQDALHIWSPKELEQTSILQVNRCFLVWEHRKNIYIADQHAVHERILYEQIKRGFYDMATKKTAYTLPNPHSLKLSVLDSHGISDHLFALETMGFRLSQKAKKWCLLAVPHFLKNRDLDTLISEILHNLHENEEGSALDHITHATITYMACREAIKAGDYVSEDEAKNLISKLFECENPYSCPHGRPTVQLITDADLKAMFKRS
nr:hypothetical protein [Candidatus Woesebacteria bacterium]